MEFRIFGEKDKEKYSQTILGMLKRSDNDFVPPLSKRSSTTQGNLKQEADFGETDGIVKYHAEMMKQNILGAFEGNVFLGFVSFKDNFTSDVLKEEYLPNIYISTLVLNPEARGKGTTAKMYDYLFYELYPERNIFTRTWSTNMAHIKILSKFDFSEMKRIKNDRGEGIDTVYFSKIRN